MHSGRQSKLYKFYLDQSAELLNSIKSMESIDPNNKSSSGDFNILLLGPAGIHKSLLIKNICKSMSRVQNLKTETVHTQGLILTRTELTKAKFYKISNQKEQKERRGTNLLEFHERISLNSLNSFSTLFGLIQETSQVVCGGKAPSKKTGHLPIQSIIVVLEAQSQLSPEELDCVRHILHDLKQRQIQPILAVCIKPAQITGPSEQEHLEKIEGEIKKAQRLFSVQRENVFALQLTEDDLSPESGYYLLRLIETSLRQACEVCSKHPSKVKDRGWFSSIMPCWI